MKVSVCVQTYNQVNYIKPCLDGILMQQTSFDFEIILGEDESADGTREICKDYALKYPERIKLHLRNRKDVIKIDGRATGRFNLIENLKASSGEYIAFCEGDDYWIDPLKLQKQVDFLDKNPDYAICFHNVKIYAEEDRILKGDTVTRSVPEITSIKDLALGNFIHTPSVMLRNKFEIPNWYDQVSLGDWTLYMTVIGAHKIKKLDQEMAVYRVHGGSLWSSTDRADKIKRTRRDVQIVLNNTNFKDKAVIEILQNRITETPKNQKKNTSGNLIKRLKKKLKKLN